MAISSLSSTQSGSGVAVQQIQQQQAQRNADQAEQTARSLRVAAQSAQSAANRAQENARTIKVESGQADSRSNQARQGLVAMKSIAQVQSGFDTLRQQISSVLNSDFTDAAPLQTAPVINTSGQETGTLISVTA